MLTSSYPIPSFLDVLRFYQSKQDRYRSFRLPAWGVDMSAHVPSNGPFRYEPEQLGLRLTHDGIIVEDDQLQGIVVARRANDDKLPPPKLDRPLPKRAELVGAYAGMPIVGLLCVARSEPPLDFDWNRIFPYRWDPQQREFVVYDGPFLPYAKASLRGEKEHEGPPPEASWWAITSGMRVARESAIIASSKMDVARGFVIESNDAEGPHLRVLLGHLPEPLRRTDLPDPTHHGTYLVLCEQWFAATRDVRLPNVDYAVPSRENMASNLRMSLRDVREAFKVTTDLRKALNCHDATASASKKTDPHASCPGCPACDPGGLTTAKDYIP